MLIAFLLVLSGAVLIGWALSGVSQGDAQRPTHFRLLRKGDSGANPNLTRSYTVVAGGALVVRGVLAVLDLWPFRV